MNKIKLILAVLFGLTPYLGSLSAFADDAKVIGIEEIVVTGTKREVSSQDVPIAVTAISGEAVQQQFRNDILAITKQANAEDYSKQEFSHHTHRIEMDGQAVFKQGIQCVQQSFTSILNQANIGVDDIQYVVSHQANIRILTNIV